MPALVLAALAARLLRQRGRPHCVFAFAPASAFFASLAASGIHQSMRMPSSTGGDSSGAILTLCSSRSGSSPGAS